MDFFYQRRSVNTSIYIKPLEASAPHDVLEFYDQVHVGPDVLAALSVQQLDRLTLSISPETQVSADPSQRLDSLICRAIVDHDMVRDVFYLLIRRANRRAASRFGYPSILRAKVWLATIHPVIHTTPVKHSLFRYNCTTCRAHKSFFGCPDHSKLRAHLCQFFPV
jgi:hypothetical protein